MMRTLRKLRREAVAVCALALALSGCATAYFDFIALDQL